LKLTRLLAGTLVIVLIAGLGIPPAFASDNVGACTVYAGAIDASTGDFGTVTHGTDALDLIATVEVLLPEAMFPVPAWITGMDFDALGNLFVTVGDPNSDHFIGQLNPDTGDQIGDFVKIVDDIGTAVSVNDLAIDRATGTIYGMGNPGSGAAIYTIDPDTGVATKKMLNMFDMANAAEISDVNRTLPGGIAFSDGILTAVVELRRGNSPSPPPNVDNDVYQFNIDVSGDSLDLQSSVDVDGPRDEGNNRGLTYCENGTLMYTRDVDSSDVGVIDPAGGTTTTSTIPDQFFGDIAIRPLISVGGIEIPIDSTALLLAGLQTSTIWMLPVLAGAGAVGAYYIKTRMNKD